MSTERKPAPNALWAYLLQKDLPASSDFAATPMIPSMAPVDRTNTSMRMLIHDMQTTLEKFSTRVDTLLINVKDAKTEVVNCNRISESERERVLDEISNSSKKVQTELKACIGAPSQASSLELVQKSQSSAENSIQALNKRIDAIQMAVIAQLVQSQNHAMQIIQDQQHSILTAVLPLLPLVQTFPMYADQVKTFITDNVLSSISSLSRDIDNMKFTLSDRSVPLNSMRSVSNSAVAVLPPFAENRPTRKRTNSRLNQDDARSGRSQSDRPHSVDPATSNPCTDHHKKPRLDSILPTTSPELVGPHTANSPAKHAVDVRESLIADRSASPACGSVTSSGYIAAPRPKYTTRTPLADILPRVNHATIQFRKSATESSFSGPAANLPMNVQRMHASSQSGKHPLPSARVDEATPSASTAAPINSNISATATKPDNFVPPTANKDRKTPESAPAAPSIHPQPISKAIKLEEVLRSPLKCYVSIPSSPLSSLSPSPALAPAQPVLKTQGQHSASGMARRQVTFATSNQAFTSSTCPGPSVPLLRTLDSMSASMSLRDRRAQMSMLGRTASSAKRFIPLGSSSDEEG